MSSLSLIVEERKISSGSLPGDNSSLSSLFAVDCSENAASLLEIQASNRRILTTNCLTRTVLGVLPAQ